MSLDERRSRGVQFHLVSGFKVTGHARHRRSLTHPRPRIIEGGHDHGPPPDEIAALLCSALLSAAVSISTPAHALELRWASGGSAIGFTAASRCTLLLSASETEATLPSEWRLQWATDSCDVQILAASPASACGDGVSDVAQVEPPTTTADSASHMPTARFCSATAGSGATARYVFDLPADARARFRVVGISPVDGTVMVSNEAVTNGGVNAPYPPAILKTETVHQSTEYQFRASGVGLESVQSLALTAHDGSWRQPLAITEQGGTAMVARASLAAVVPACDVEATGADQTIASAALAAEPEPQLLEPESGCMQNFFERVFDDPYEIQPKDFAFVLGGWTPSGVWTFHLFYIRQNQFTLRDTNIVGRQDSTSWNIGHAVSNNLEDWPSRDIAGSMIIDTAAIRTRPGRFDSRHVWAPSIVKHGLTYYMFYTGVDDAGRQRLGLATSSDLVTWTQGDSVFDATRAGNWVDQSMADFRDPFVMEDPDNPGGWLLYFGAGSAERPGRMVVGVAKSSGDLTQWQTSRPIRETYLPYARVESPHAFFRQGKWWLLYTPSDTVYATSNWDDQLHVSSPSDTTSANWSTPVRLQSLVVDQPGIYYNWHATEYLEVSATNDIRYLAAYNDYPVSISITQMHPANPPYLFKDGCPTAADVDGVGPGIDRVRLSLSGANPARTSARFRIEVPSRMHLRLSVFDVLGRRMRTLFDGEMAPGRRVVEWDGSTDDGRQARSGVYFVHLASSSRDQTIRLPFIR
jgi:hypothetical protein